MYYFTSDEHYGHKTIIYYSERPFSSVDEMNSELIRRFNSKVSRGDITVHLGDFAFYKSYDRAMEIISQLNGQHIFLRGSHDMWLPREVTRDMGHEIWERHIDKQTVVACHYAMRHWAKSHYGSWQLHGHSHGHLDPIGKLMDVGVDSHDYYPVSWGEVQAYMKGRPDNKPNHVPREKNAPIHNILTAEENLDQLEPL